MNVNQINQVKFRKTRIKCSQKSKRHEWATPEWLQNDSQGLVQLEVCMNCGVYKKTETDLDENTTDVTYIGLDMESDDWVFLNFR